MQRVGNFLVGTPYGSVDLLRSDDDVLIAVAHWEIAHEEAMKARQAVLTALIAQALREKRR